MAKLPNSFDWQNSASHIDLLELFSKLRDPEVVLNWEFYGEDLLESVKAGIERLKKEGALVPASLDDKVSFKFKVPELKDLLKNNGVKGVEGKEAMVRAWIQANQTEAESLTRSLNLLKCSEIGFKAIRDFKEGREHARKIAQSQEVEALLNSDPAKAFKIHKKYMRTEDPDYRGYSGSETIGYLFTRSPSQLVGKLGEEAFRIIRMIAAMIELWPASSTAEWIPDEFVMERDELTSAVELLEQYIRLHERLAEEQSDDFVTVSFPEEDFEICKHCRTLDGKTFKVSEFPEWPFAGCESEVGCYPDLDWVRSIDLMEDGTFLENAQSSVADHLNSLRQLKAMLEEGLITQTEYEDKKKEILARM